MAMSPLELQKWFQRIQLNHMLDEGYVSTMFLRLQRDRDPTNPYHLVLLINSYCSDMEATFSYLRSVMEHPFVDFNFLVSQSRYIAWRSARMGAEHVREGCSYLFQACEQFNKQKFYENLEMVYNDFKATRTKLLDFAKLEQKIVELGGWF